MSTKSHYDACFREFAEGVEALGFSSLPATPDAVAAWVSWVTGDPERRIPSVGFSASHVDGVLAAVSDRHRQHGYADPCADLGAEGRQDLRRVLRQAVPTIRTVPLDVDDLRRLAGLALARSRPDAAREAALLLLMEYGVRTTSLKSSGMRLTGASVTFATDTGVTTRLQLACTCRQRVALHAPCLLCSLRCLTRPTGSVNWFPITGQGERVAAAADRVRTSKLVGEQRDALIVGLVRPRLVTFLRTRAWILLGFHRGLRAHDLRMLLRREVSGFDTAPGEPLVMVLRRSKGDPYGETVNLSCRPADAPVLCAVRALREWQLVRDALSEEGRSDEGYMFCRTDTAGQVLRHAPLNRMTDLAIWRQWRSRAGLADNLTQHGLRGGFILAADQQGSGLERIAFTTRHASEQAAAAYITEQNALRAAGPATSPDSGGGASRFDDPAAGGAAP